jgi:RimJ/RimL family protein N-acetyltransferase
MADVRVLTGDRVTLRAPRLGDAEELFASIASDPEVPRYMSWPTHPDVGETRRVITELFNVGDERTWLIELRHSGEIVGVCGFRPVQAHTMDFGYHPVFPNLGKEPQDVLKFGKAVR